MPTDLQPGQKVLIRGVVMGEGQRGIAVRIDEGMILDIRLDELEPEPKSYWLTEEGQVEQAIREGLRDAGVLGPLNVLVGSIMEALRAK